MSRIIIFKKSRIIIPSKELEKLSKEEISKHYIDLLKRIRLVANTYEKMYNDGQKTIDTYNYVGIFRDLIVKSLPTEKKPKKTRSTFKC